MNIHQLSVSHDERQDRLLLRLNTLANEEFRFWLTRRMVFLLLPALTQMVARLEASQPGFAASDAQAQSLLTELKRDAFLQQADFATPYAVDAPQRPLGEEPLLITDVQLNHTAQQSLEVIFLNTSAQPPLACTLNLQAPLVHGLIHLMAQTASHANWALPPASDGLSANLHPPAGTNADSDPAATPRPLMH
jgi:hypothetical protein